MWVSQFSVIVRQVEMSPQNGTDGCDGVNGPNGASPRALVGSNDAGTTIGPAG